MALRAFGVLLAIWAILAGIAFAAGVIPTGAPHEVTANGDGSEEEERATREGEDEDAADAGVDGAAQSAEVAAEGESAETEGDNEAPAEPPPTYAVCTVDTTDVSLAALEVVGDPRPEVALGCGPKVHVFAFDEEPEPSPLLVATFDAAGAASPSAQVRLAAGKPADMDVDGDGLGDLVLPFRGLTSEGDVRGGALHLLRRSAMGAFEAPILLAPIAADRAVLAQLDGHPGMEILATNRGSDLARRPSEVWVFTGGPAPARASVLRAGLGDVDVTVADLDRDGEQDAVVTAAGADQVRIHFGDGTAHFPRTAEIETPGAREVVSGDVDGDGGEDVLVAATGLFLVVAGPPESLSPRAIEGAPAGLRGISLRDVDGDRKRDIVGIDGQNVVWLQQGDDLGFTLQTLLTIEGAPIHDYALADVDGDGKTDLVALGRAPEGGTPWALTIVPDVREATRGRLEPAGASAPQNAPLMLNVTLR